MDELQQLCTWAYEEEDDDFRLAYEKLSEHKDWSANGDFKEAQLKDLVVLGKEKAGSVKKLKAQLHKGVEAFAELLAKFEKKDSSFTKGEQQIVQSFL